MKKWFGLFKTAAKDFSADGAPHLGASVAYYTIFSLSPLLIIVLAIASFFMGAENNARDQIVSQIGGIVGPKGAEAISSMVNQPGAQKSGIIATVIAIVTLLLGSTAVFMELQAALNTIWDVKQKPGGGIWNFIKHRLLSFAAVLSIGFLLLVSLVLTAAISSFGQKLGSMMPGFEAMSQLLNFVASFGLVMLLFAFMYKFMPDVQIPWKVVWVGAAFTALLFAVGKFGLGMYLGKKSGDDAYGAASSLVLLLLWVYYSAQILFFGAEVTQAYAKMRGIKVLPKEHAEVADVTLKESSPTKPEPPAPEAPAAKPERARPVSVPGRATPRPGFVMPAILLLAALVLPNASRRRHV
ncbi:MAG TPA: YihY/virulence factor BrkB family protein [Verrucomicrobiae bacterium]|nr:YihY/virulence factor BrkB family protein [Verrucomicrobiae bacterium]